MADGGWWGFGSLVAWGSERVDGGSALVACGSSRVDGGWSMVDGGRIFIRARGLCVAGFGVKFLIFELGVQEL